MELEEEDARREVVDVVDPEAHQRGVELMGDDLNVIYVREGEDGEDDKGTDLDIERRESLLHLGLWSREIMFVREECAHAHSNVLHDDSR